ncbi:cbb3-type cytochrome c oxidase N-terminal domain-containing protein [Luteitalea sp.]|uniref:cbb3-type cytochrome c oxidase N-terminal domain-containing protein n=1 Tax=Luteitalea sp. TaxID=2004800 RepID=UPI0037CBE68E
MSDKKDELLNHEYDGIREFDNALPRWWLYGFYFTIVFGIVYAINYHGLSKPMWGQPGMVAEYTAEVEAANRLAANRPKAAGPSATLVALTDPASLQKGQAIFESNDNLCHSCHRKDLGGLVGPNLTDNLWIHGCTPAEMVKNVATGFPPLGMLPYGSGKTLSDEQLLLVVSYVLSKQGTNPENPRAVNPEREKPCS